MSCPRFLLLLALPLLGLGCAGSRPSGDQAGTLNGVLVISPANASLIVNQTLQFQASTPWGAGAIWSVQPPSAGTITPGGLFTASATPGTFTVLAMWDRDVRYAASTQLTLLPQPPPNPSTPSMVQAEGGLGTGAQGTINVFAVLGEDVPAVVSGSPNQAIQVRHGFLPPGHVPAK